MSGNLSNARLTGSGGEYQWGRVDEVLGFFDFSKVEGDLWFTSSTIAPVLAMMLNK